MDIKNKKIVFLIDVSNNIINERIMLEVNQLRSLEAEVVILNKPTQEQDILHKILNQVYFVDIIVIIPCSR